MLNPEQRASAIAYIQKHADALQRQADFNNRRWGLTGDPFYARYLQDLANEQRYYNAAITALTNEAALAEQVRMLREALEAMPHSSLACMKAGCYKDPITGKADIEAGHTPICHWHKKTAALALDFPEAARQAAENAERAGLLEWWFTESNEAARNRIRDKRNESGDQWPEYQWTAEQWIAEVRTAKEAGNG